MHARLFIAGRAGLGVGNPSLKDRKLALDFGCVHTTKSRIIFIAEPRHHDGQTLEPEVSDPWLCGRLKTG